MESREDDGGGGGVAVVRAVEGGGGGYEHGVVGAGLRVAETGHVVPAEEEVPGGVGRDVVVRVRHGVAVLGAVLLLASARPVPHAVSGGEFDACMAQVGRVSRVHEGIQHHEDW